MALVDGTSHGDGRAVAALLSSKSPTPIAHLGPDLPDPASRVVRGEVTITWPYNSVTRTLAFLLAEPDVRLRRAKGQIRIVLQGPSAKAASESGLGAGDELLLGLAGAEFSKDVSPGRIPGARVDWQLQFDQKLVLQVKFGESGETKHIHVDHPEPEQADGPVAEATRGATPDPMAPPNILDIPSTLRKISDLPPDEYRSPAFVKRARLSYGALFEGGFDLFEEDGGVKGRGRKRTRFGRDSSAWRYSSQSPSPEPMEEEAPEDVTPKPRRRAESHQIIDVDMEQGTPESVSASVWQPQRTPAPPETPVPAPRERSTSPVQNEQTPISRIKQAPVAPPHEAEPAPTELQAQASPAERGSGFLPDAIAAGGKTAKLARPAPQDQPGEPNVPPESDTGAASQTTLFGPKAFSSTFPSFGTGVPAGPRPAVSLADQVRFGFSHTPQPTHDSSPPKPAHAPEPEFHGPDPYPLSYLGDTSAPPEYAGMSTYPDMMDEQDDTNVPSQAMPLDPPAIERFGHGQWEMSTQSPHYNPIEGGHFGPDALDEGERLAATDQPPLHADHTSPKQVPEGFAAYGRDDVSEDQQDAPENPAPPHEYEPLVENEDTISGSEVGVDDEEDEDEKEDEVAFGERVEEGDYDQRNYDVPSDDYEGLSEEEDEIELEAEERYGNGEVYDDDDGEGEEWDEDEEEYESEEEEEESEEEDFDAKGYQAMKAPRAAAPAAPVVISLLSDSEDEDEPAPAPKKPAPSAQAVRPPEPPTSSEELSGSGQPSSPSVLETVETDGATKEHVQDNVLNRIHVVDFATRLEQGTSRYQQPRAPLAGMDSGFVPAVGTSQSLGSFELSSSSEGLFVSQPNSQHAPSESSSEGLFISQPRARSPDTEDKQIDTASDEFLETTDDGSTDGGQKSESDAPEQDGTHDDFMSVEEEEQPETISESSGGDDDESLPDADDASFASQVEMVEDIDSGASEDEHMNTDKEAEEVVESEEDVDMIDAGPAQPESASVDQTATRSPQREAVGETSAIATEPVTTETASSTTAVAAESEPAQGAYDRAREEPRSTPLASNGQELATEELLGKTRLENTPKGRPEGPEASMASQNELATQTTSQGVVVDLIVPDQDGTGTHKMVTQTQEEADLVVPDSQIPVELPTVVKLDDDASQEARPAARVSTPEQNRKDEAPEDKEGSAQKSDKSGVVQNPTPPDDDLEDETMILEQLTQEQQQYCVEEAAGDTVHARSSTPDLSVTLARQAVASRRNKQPPEPVRTSPRVTRARSNSLRSNATNDTPEKEGDNSVSLARAALASPSRNTHATPAATPTTSTAAGARTKPPATMAALKSELAKRLRTDLPECLQLKSLRSHMGKFPNALVVVTTAPPAAPTRAKGGPRQYFMSFHATDPSAAPGTVVEVQMYHPHTDALPVVAPGDVVLLQKFQVVSLSGRGVGLRTGAESAWAVWDEASKGGGADGGGGAPQIRGRPVEDWDKYVGYAAAVREWFGLVMADGAAREKLERADRKLAEAGGK
ncbi:hypothetical protein C8A05DRAFT_11835 [Staphylotrichum tortipilum]|uniref:Telomeric single stranded DNA binding POT1/Cdc13 domain-containing protein n=1 Tax=Staphylotrichum tortipilum TaxID=2831512 RepID=A0AAN6MUB7_9PEZI|nr:hypothetical protein C8A05DRAFT_11835 [Staphylotrichum longicolle]